MANQGWSTLEVELIVADYFAMFRSELENKPYNKSEHRRNLSQHLNKRSDASIEKKHQNISAVLVSFDMPYISGYKPLFNYQRSLLPEIVSNYLKQNRMYMDLFDRSVNRASSAKTYTDFSKVLVSPPNDDKKKINKVSEESKQYSPNKVNYLEKEADNISLGDAGEKFVISYERERLIRAGKERLADKIEQVSETRGPYAGFDILSFDENGKDRYIEAKTTNYAINTPFFITPNEIRLSKEKADSYFLYRVFRYESDPQIFTLQGNIEDHCELRPFTYRAFL